MTSLLSILALVSLAAPPQQAQIATSPSELVRTTWQGCAQCHVAPDTSVEHDARWIGLNRATTCLTGDAATPENRARMIAFLRDGLAPLPPLYRALSRDGDGVAAPDSSGWVSLPATEGSAYLRTVPAEPTPEDASGDGEATTFLRVVWSRTETGSHVALPRGEYEIIGYSFYREGDGGTRWTASATVQKGQAPDRIEVDSSKAVALPIEPTVLPDLQAVAEGEDLDIQFQLRNVAGDRMTLTRDGELVEPRWVAFAPERSRQLASGRFTPS
jgi:hypothetical protein